MSELFRKVQATKLNETQTRALMQSGKDGQNASFLDALREEVKRKLDERLLKQAEEIGLRNRMRK